MATLYPGEDEMLDALEVLGLSCDPMYVVDDRCRIVFWNKPLQHLLGYTHDETAGRSCAMVLQGDDHFGNRYCSDSCSVQMIARRGDAVRPFRLRVRTKEGPRLTLEVTVMRLVLRTSRRLLVAHMVRPVEVEQIAEVATPAPEPPRVHKSHNDARVRELTSREIEILGMLAGGQDARAIARTLTVSPLTIRNHIQHIFEKLEVHSRSQAVAFAYKTRIIG